MGVIRKILYRGNILARPRHRNLFLDMEENIHIHYRDLRIELSRNEFEEFAATFRKQSGELQAIIEEKDYQDGKLPNANQDDVRVWTESRLKHEVRYHPQRFSLEDCGDGYHFHYRNYKILIDREEFRQLAQLFRNLDVDGPVASSHDEVLELLNANEIDFVLDAGNLPGEVLAIAVASYHIPKIREIFNCIGFSTQTEGNELRFSGARLEVIVRASRQRDALEYRRLRSMGSTHRLVDYLSRLGTTIDVDELNRIKCQVLDLHGMLRKGGTATVETDPELWLYAPDASAVIFSYSPETRGGKRDADELYRRWSTLLAHLGLGFVKPRKKLYRNEQQQALGSEVDEALRCRVAAFAAVSRIHLMGSATRAQLGRYNAPFIHGKLAKLGSDIDILVEIDPALETDVPREWQLINPRSSNHCAVYHVGEIDLHDGAGDWPQAHPNVEFVQHLIDAYVYFPSRGHLQEKEAFLRRFGARLFYDRSRDGHLFASEELAQVAAAVQQNFALEQLPAVEKLQVSSENTLYKVFAATGVLVLKLFKVAGNYRQNLIAEHAAYESRLVSQLKQRGIPTAGVIEPRDGAAALIQGSPALLFERIPGEIRQKPPYRLQDIGRALAAIHQTQIGQPLELQQDFAFDATCMIWLPAFDQYLHRTWNDQPVAEALARLAPIASWHHRGENRSRLFGRSAIVHCHGDVNPKNVILHQDAAWFFDFNNAFHGPRMADIVDGAFECSLADKYVHLADFARFDEFVEAYSAHSALAAAERADLPRWVELIGLIKFTKELRVILQRPANEKLRRDRALAIAGYVLQRAAADDGGLS